MIIGNWLNIQIESTMKSNLDELCIGDILWNRYGVCVVMSVDSRYVVFLAEAFDDNKLCLIKTGQYLSTLNMRYVTYPDREPNE